MMLKLEPLEPRILLSGLLDSLTTTASPVEIRLPRFVIDEFDEGEVIPYTNVSGPLINMDGFRSAYPGYDGSGFATVILDTGIDVDHSFFGPDNNGDGISDRIVYQWDYAYSDSDASDLDGHGSNVSSIVASSDSTYTGMAPGANIIHLKVLDDFGSGNFSWLEEALQWVVANVDTYNIASVNMSLGDTSNHNTATSAYGLGDELAALAASDVIVVSAAGNDFWEFNSVQGVSYPAADPNSLAVSAVWDSDQGQANWNGPIDYTTDADRVVSFSQRHSTLTDVMAPGANITGANWNGGTVTMGGTSQASPHIAGVAVVAQQLAVDVMGRRLTLAEFRNLLDTTSVTINDGDDEDDNVINTGLNFPRVDMLALGNGISPTADGPDLTVQTLTGPSEADPGETIDLNVTLINNGDENADAYKVQFFLSEDTLIDPSEDFALTDKIDRDALAADATDSWVQSVIVEGSSAETVYIGIVVDVDNEVDETVETNNTASITVETGPTDIDLIIKSLSGSTIGIPGMDYDMDVELANVGDLGADAYKVQFFVSTDTTIDPTEDTPLTEKIQRNPLSSGQTDAWTQTMTLPDDPMGTVYLGIVVDIDDDVDETIETNNTDSLAIYLGPNIDLTVSDLSGESQAAAGTNYDLNVTVKNEGINDSQAYQVQFFLSNDTAIDAGTDFPLTNKIARNALAGEQTDPWAQTLGLPEGLVGVWYLGIIVDIDNEVNETNETNNTAALAVSVGPDLAPTALSGDTETHVGGTINITSSLTNSGAEAAENFRADYFLSANASKDASDTLLGSMNITHLGAGQSRDDDLLFNVPLSLIDALGDYYLIVLADALDQVPETDETNNVLISEETVALQSPYDLEVTTVQAPDVAFSGLPVSVAGTVKNVGTLPTQPALAQYFLSRNPTFDLTAELLGSPFAIDELNPDGSFSDARTLGIPRVASGAFYIGLIVDTDAELIESDETNNILTDTASTSVTPPEMISLDAAQKRYSFTDSGGNEVEIRYAGPGRIALELINGATTGADIGNLTVLDSTEKSKLHIKVKNGRTTLRLLGIDKPIGKIIAPDVDLVGTGAFIHQIDTLKLGSIGSAHVPEEHPQVLIATADDKLRISVTDVLDDSLLTGPGRLDKFTADRISGGDIRFDEIGKVIISDLFFGNLQAKTGDVETVTFKRAMKGTIDAAHDLKRYKSRDVFSGIIRAGRGVEKFMAGAVEGAIISAGQRIGTVKIKANCRNSQLLAGYDIGEDLTFGGDDDNLEVGRFDLLKVNGAYEDTIAGAGIGPDDPEVPIADWQLTLAQTDGARSGSMGKVTLKHVPAGIGGHVFGLGTDSFFDRITVNGDRREPGDNVIGDFTILLI